MGFLKDLVAKSIPSQNYKHNVYDSQLSQYSSLPRYYYIEGKRYDIDSPKSVTSIPVCKTSFKINEEFWGIDTILREHVNRYYSNIPENLKAACYPKISDFEHSNYKTESNAEKQARIKLEQEQIAKETSLSSISIDDIKQFHIEKFKVTKPFYTNKMCIMLIDINDRHRVMDELCLLNHYVEEACQIAGISCLLSLPSSELQFEPIKLNDEINQYYTYFECVPYTKSGKTSKYPLILHYATKNFTEYQPATNFFGEIYYMQDGQIGKSRMIFWVKHTMYKIELVLKGEA